MSDVTVVAAQHKSTRARSPVPPSAIPTAPQGEIPPHADAVSAVEPRLGATARIGHNSEEGEDSVLSPLMEVPLSNGVEKRERGRVEFRSVTFGYPTRPGEAAEAIKATAEHAQAAATEAARRHCSCLKLLELLKLLKLLLELLKLLKLLLELLKRHKLLKLLE